jgi:hypothetical protein
MRKLFALAMVAMLSLTVAFAVIGCGQTAQETPAPAAETTTPPADESAMPADTGSTMETMQDTTAMSH